MGELDRCSASKNSKFGKKKSKGKKINVSIKAGKL